MDATTQKKVTSIAFVALLVGSLFLVAVPATVSAQSTAPATIDAELPTGVASNTANVTSGGPIEYGETRTITLTNITRASGRDVGSTWALTPAGYSGAIDNRTAVESNASHIQVAFPAVSFNVVGTWTITGPDGYAVNFTVSAKTNLQVALSANAFTYTENFTQFTVTVTDLTTGAPVADVALAFNIPTPPLNPKTNTNGQYVFLGFIGGVGSYTLNASKDVTGTSEAEFRGSATFTVVPASIGVKSVSTNILRGFAAQATWNLTYPSNATGILAMGNYQTMNLTVTLPNGTKVSHNTTGLAVGNVTGSLVFQNTTAGGITVAAGDGINWQYDTNGNFSFRPGTTWPAGTYTFELRVNTRVNPSNDCAACVQNSEYVVTWTLAPSEPQAINVNVFRNPGTGNVALNATSGLRVLEATGSPSINTAAGHTIYVSIEGDSFGKYPGATGIPELDAGFGATTANITLTGDVMPGWSASATYSTANGTATITSVVPTKGGGSIAINIKWQNVTTTINVPITEGAVLSTDVDEIIVDRTTQLTVTLKDINGNTIPDGKVYIFAGLSGNYPGAEGLAINGTGTAGNGQNGQYTFSVRPTAVGNMTVFAIIGRSEGGSDFRNFSYLNVRVVPAHDLVVGISTTTAMASNTTHVVANVTLPDGIGVSTTGNHRVYFLSAAQKDALEANGTSALPTYPQTSTTNGTDVVAGGATLLGSNWNVTLGTGTYYVYVCSNWTASDCATAKHDNLRNYPTIVVSAYNVTFTPARIANIAQVQRNTTVNVMVYNMNGEPVNGTLAIDNAGAALTSATCGALCFLEVNETGTNVTSLQVVNGMAQFVATGKFSGSVWFAFNPAGGHTTHAARADDAFVVTTPDVTVTPDRTPIGVAQTFGISVKSLSGEPLAGLLVQMCDTTAPITGVANGTVGCTDAVVTNANGSATVGKQPLDTRPLYLYVNGTRTGTFVTVFAGLSVEASPTSPTEGETVTLTVRRIGGGAESGVEVTVTRNGTQVLQQTTSSNGQVVLSNVQAGSYAVTASKPGVDSGTLTFNVGAAPEEQPTPEADLQLHEITVPATGTVGSPMEAIVEVHNDGDAAGSGTIVLLVNDVQRASQSVTVAAGGSQNIALQFTPVTAGTFRVTARLAETGETLAERTITVSTPTTPTPTTSSPTPTTSSPTPTTTVSPSPEEPSGVPGFEFVALVGALGAALLVLRRRN